MGLNFDKSILGNKAGEVSGEQALWREAEGAGVV